MQDGGREASYRGPLKAAGRARVLFRDPRKQNSESYPHTTQTLLMATVSRRRDRYTINHASVQPRQYSCTAQSSLKLGC